MSTFMRLRRRFAQCAGCVLLWPMLSAAQSSAAGQPAPAETSNAAAGNGRVVITDLGDPRPPTAEVVAESFEPMGARWLPVTGRWAVEGGDYVSRGVGDKVAVITEYFLTPVSAPQPTLTAKKFVVRARMINNGTLDTQRVGIIYDYQDAANFYEASVSGTGALTVNRVLNGVVTQLRRGDAFVVRNTWFDLQVERDGTDTHVMVDGAFRICCIKQPELTSGQVGLSSAGVVGRFDNLFVGVPIGTQPFSENFADGVADGWQPLAGAWGVKDATYSNAAVQQTNITLAPIQEAGRGGPNVFTLYTRMFNPFGAAGNQVGFVFNYLGPDDYQEVVFAPTGVAKINHILRGVPRNIATASYNGRPSTWFDVKFAIHSLKTGCCGTAATVAVDGANVFDDVNVRPGAPPEGKVGLIAHWAPGRFRDFSFDYGVFEPLSADFSAEMPTPTRTLGAWNVSNGVLANSFTSTAADATNLMVIPCCRSTGLSYEARLRNDFGGPGNLVGLVYDYQGGGLNAGDYYEIVFSPATATKRGNMLARKVLSGVTYEVASTSHRVRAGTWFKVRVSRSAGFTVVTVSDDPDASLVFNQGSLHPDDFDEPRETSIGVITHFSQGRFDDLSVREVSGR